jgi:TRAP-type C4-dicarboxylate transport system substrate-binding protein
LATFLPSSHISNDDVLKPFADSVRYSSSGMLSINIYASGELGRNPKEQLVLVERGVADIALILPLYHRELFDELEIVSLPNLFQTSTEGSIVLTRLYERGLIKGFNSFIPLSLFTTYPAVVHCRSAVMSINDLQGLKIRVSNEILADTIRMLGAEPIRLSSSETYQAINTGAIDGITLSWRSMWEAKIHEVAPFHYELPLGATPTLLVMNRHRLDRMPPQLQNQLKEHAGEKLSEIWGKAYDHVNSLYKQRVRDQGQTIKIPSSEDSDTMKKITEQIVSRWSLEKPHRKELVNTFRREVEKIQ